MGNKEVSPAVIIAIVAAVIVLVGIIGWKVMAPKRATPSGVQGDPSKYYPGGGSAPGGSGYPGRGGYPGGGYPGRGGR